MSDMKLNLLENATDSLSEALCKYQEGKEGNQKAYKFCVQHLAHFLELILKYYVTQSHPLLVYKNPFAKNINEESATIGLFEAMNFLKNEGLEISTKFEQDLTWFKKLRNNIEHHKFEMNVEVVEETIGRLVSAFVEFDNSHKNINLASLIDRKQYDLFHELANTYEGRLNKANMAVNQAFMEFDPRSGYELEIYQCDECGHESMIPDESSNSGYKCAFCGNEESENIEVNCGGCDIRWPIWEMRLNERTEGEDEEYYCPHCLYDPEYRRVD